PTPVNDDITNSQATVATYISSHGHTPTHPGSPSPNIRYPPQSSTTTTNNNTLTTDQNFNTQSKTTKIQANNSANPKQWRCDWKDCKYRGTFRHKAELMRHIEFLHVAPGSHKCPSCRRKHNRKDNLGEHLKVRH
ncbi:hypothetical protein ABOM_005999, partial [Aspergillus bombycis]